MIVLNHGTLNRMQEQDNIITILARKLGYPGDEGGSDKLYFGSSGGDGVYVTNGVGSAELDADLVRLGMRTKEEQELRQKGDAHTKWVMHSGVNDGKEVQDNVKDYVQAVRAYQSTKGHLPKFVDFVGYSRGAVTCFKMMNEEGNFRDDNWTPKYRIFAIDPVPGTTSEENKHMWSNVEIASAMETRVKCRILLSEGERREAFIPMLPEQARLREKKEVCDLDTMPGKHVAMCGSDGNHQTPMFELIKDMVAYYLMFEHEVWKGDYWKLHDMIIENSWEKLRLYASIVNNLYALGSKGGFMNQGGSWGAAETIMAETDYNVGRRFHVPGSGRDAPTAAGFFKADGNATIRDTGKVNGMTIRSNKLDKRSRPMGKQRVFANSSHRKLCLKLFPGAVCQHLKKPDTAVNWKSETWKESRAALKTILQMVSGKKPINVWINTLVGKLESDNRSWW